MSFWQMLGLMSGMTTILGVFLTAYALFNNRTLKEESRNTREILSRIEQGQVEARKEMAEARKEMAEAMKVMAEAIRHLAQLIALEGDKTREAIRAQP